MASQLPAVGQPLWITSARPRVGDGSRAGAALQPAAMDGSTGPTSAAMNAGFGTSTMTPSVGSGLFLRIWSNSSIFSRCIVAFLLLDLFVVLNNATCSVRARAFGASFLLVPDLLM